MPHTFACHNCAASEESDQKGITMRLSDRFVAACASIALITCGLIPTPAIAAPVDELAAARQELDAYGKQLAEVQTKLVKGADELNITESQIVERQQEADETKEQLTQAQALLAEHMRENYRAGSASLISVLLEAETVEDLVSRVYYLDKIAERNANEITEVRDLQTSLETQLTELEEQRDEQQHMLEEAAQHAEEYNDRIAEAQSYYNDLNEKVQQQLAAEAQANARKAQSSTTNKKPTNDYGVITDGVQNAMAAITEERVAPPATTKDDSEAKADENAAANEETQKDDEQAAKPSETVSEESQNDEQSTEPEENETQEEAAEPTPEPTPEPAPEPAPTEDSTDEVKEPEEGTEEAPAPEQEQNEEEPAPAAEEPEAKPEESSQSPEQKPAEEDEAEDSEEEPAQENEPEKDPEPEPEPKPAPEEKQEEPQLAAGQGNEGARSDIISMAYQYLGVPYVWGGKSPSGFDCSGLTTYCYENCGVDVGGNRTTYQLIDWIQSRGNWKTSMDELQPGDMIFPSAGHTAIYLGNGRMIHAPHEGDVVREADVYAFYGGGWAG